MQCRFAALRRASCSTIQVPMRRPTLIDCRRSRGPALFRPPSGISFVATRHLSFSFSIYLLSLFVLHPAPQLLAHRIRLPCNDLRFRPFSISFSRNHVLYHTHTSYFASPLFLPFFFTIHHPFFSILITFAFFPLFFLPAQDILLLLSLRCESGPLHLSWNTPTPPFFFLFSC